MPNDILENINVGTLVRLCICLSCLCVYLKVCVQIIFHACHNDKSIYLQPDDLEGRSIGRAVRRNPSANCNVIEKQKSIHLPKNLNTREQAILLTLLVDPRQSSTEETWRRSCILLHRTTDAMYVFCLVVVFRSLRRVACGLDPPPRSPGTSA